MRAKKYKTEDGDYIVMDESDGNIRLAWYISEWDETGSRLGEAPQGRERPAGKDQWEVWQADNAAEPFAEGRDNDGFHFKSIARAKLALSAANQALLTGEAPWPSWAIEARENGWTPPKGWKP